MIQGDSSVFIPLDAKAVDFSSVDVDLTAIFTGQLYVRGLYNGESAAKDLKVTTLGGNAVVYANVPSGGHIYGMFTLLWHTGSTANTKVLAEK